MLASATMHSHMQHDHGAASANEQCDLNDMSPLNPPPLAATGTLGGRLLSVSAAAGRAYQNRLHVVPELSEKDEDTINEDDEADRKSEEDVGWKGYARLILPHVGLVLICVLYTFAGATVFYLVEKPHELVVRKAGLDQIRKTKEILLGEMWNLTRAKNMNEAEFNLSAYDRLDNLTKTLFEVFEQRYVTLENINAEAQNVSLNVKDHWTFAAAVFFAATTITTIGYGNLVPMTPSGRIICIFFGLFGVPLMLVTIADMGKFISDGIVWCYHKYRRLKQRLMLHRLQLMRRSSFSRLKSSRSDPKNDDMLELSMENSVTLDDDEEHPIPVTIVLLIIVGYTALGGVLLMQWEHDWNFLESFYFSFITMTTVGFGDLVATNESMYFFTLLYIVLGLAITTMCVDLVGSTYIKKIHFFGRKIQSAKDALRSMGEVMRYATFLRKKYGLTDEQLRQMQILPPGLSTADWMNNYSSKHWKEIWMHAFVPKDIHRIYYIDQRTESIRDSIRESTIQDGGSARMDLNSLASNRVHF